MLKKCTPVWRHVHVEVKMHAVVATSTFAIQNSWSEHFWTMSSAKSARDRGGEHIRKSKVLKTDGLKPLLDVEMLKTCAALWREDVQSRFRSQNGRNTPRSDHFWTFKCRFSWQARWVLRLAKSEQNDANREGFVAIAKTTAGLPWDIWKGSGLHCTALHHTALH